MAIQPTKLQPRRKGQRIAECDLRVDGLKIGTWDIEATGLNASFGYLLCVGVKPIGGKARVIRLDDFPEYRKTPWDDRALAYAAKKELEKYDILVSYNGTRYDVPFLDTRLVEGGIKPLSADIKHADLYKTVKARLRMHSGRLAALTDFLQTKDSKTPLTPLVWRKAGAGDRSALDNVAKHNLYDLITLEECFNKMVGLMDIRFAYVA